MSILVRNKYDIRNQHKNLHRIAYILSKYFFHQNSTGTSPQTSFHENCSVVSYGSNFGEKNIYLKSKLFDAVFYADFEYHVYFEPISTFDGENVEIRQLRHAKEFSL